MGIYTREYKEYHPDWKINVRSKRKQRFDSKEDIFKETSLKGELTLIKRKWHGCSYAEII